MSERSDNVVRLGSGEQAAIADELRRYWQHVVDEGVPEPLRALILRFAARGEGAEAGAAADQTQQDSLESGVIALADFRRSDCENPA